jgi:hypothetical protein
MTLITLAVALVLILVVAVALGVIGLRGFEQGAVDSGEGQTSNAAAASATLRARSCLARLHERLLA